MVGSRRFVAAMAVLLMWVFGVSAAAQAQVAYKPSGVVNVNTANLEQLMLLPGIGTKRAERIVHFRRTKPFKRIVELARVKGIGMKTVRKLKVYLVVSGPTTLTERPPRST